MIKKTYDTDRQNTNRHITYTLTEKQPTLEVRYNTFLLGKDNKTNKKL